MTSILILGTADWNQAIATNQHYVARELSGAYEVRYIESMGLRPPQLSRRDARRIMARIWRSSDNRTEREIPSNVTVVSPRTIPYHKGFARSWNSRYIHSVASASLSRPMLWTYTPITYDLEQKFDATVYHCVDLMGTFQGVDPRLIYREESRLAESGATAIASSEPVRDHLIKRGFSDVSLMKNVADIAALQFDPQSPKQPSAVFAGNLTELKVDFDLLETLLGAGVAVNLAGPVSEGGGSSGSRLERLERMGAIYHGMLNLRELGALYAECTVGLIPYVENSYTQGVSPLKTYEYLACGLSVVATPLPSLQHDSGITLGRGAEFVNHVINQIAVPTTTEIDQRVKRAREHSWEKRGVQLRAYASERLDRELDQ